MYTIIALILLGIVLVFATYQWDKARRLTESRDYWAKRAVEESARANHWNKQFNEVIEGSDGAWARRLIADKEALEKGLDEAIDDHSQDQASWEEARAQYLTTIDNLNDECNAYREVAVQKDMELRDVQQTALEMQIDLRKRPDGRPEMLGEYDRISPDAEITLADDAVLKDPSGTVIGTVDGVRNTPEGLQVDMTFNDNVPWAGKSATGVVPHDD